MGRAARDAPWCWQRGQTVVPLQQRRLACAVSTGGVHKLQSGGHAPTNEVGELLSLASCCIRLRVLPPKAAFPANAGTTSRQSSTASCRLEQGPPGLILRTVKQSLSNGQDSTSASNVRSRGTPSVISNAHPRSLSVSASARLVTSTQAREPLCTRAGDRSIRTR
jgi:hypothetical protein